MAENEWGDEGARATPRKRVPSWVWWGCGGGCLLLVLVAAAAAVLVGGVIKDALDPEKAWAGVQEILPFDQRPAGWEAHGTSVLGMGGYFLTPPPPARSLLVVQRFPSKAELDAMFDPRSPQNVGILKVGQIRDPELGTIQVQGREVRCLHFKAWMPESSRKEGDGSSVRIDVSGQGAIPVQVQITLHGELARVPAEMVTELLAPFDVWRGR